MTTGVIVAAGRWAGGQPLDIKFAIGFGFYAISMSVLSSANDELAGQFALLVLLLAAFRYLPPLLSKLQITSK